jgi:hypothetical protein
VGSINEELILACVIGVLLSKDSTGYGSVMVSGREYRAEEKICQSNILWGQREQKIGSYTLTETSLDKE